MVKALMEVAVACPEMALDLAPQTAVQVTSPVAAIAACSSLVALSEFESGRGALEASA